MNVMYFLSHHKISLPNKIRYRYNDEQHENSL